MMDIMNGGMMYMEEKRCNMEAIIAYQKFLDSIISEKGFDDSTNSVLSIIDDIVLNKEKEQFSTILEKGKILYRARIISPSDYGNTEKGIKVEKKSSSGDRILFSGYDKKNSKEPILGVSNEGRNNMAGSSYLYVASEPETACMEIKSIFGEIISLAEFKLVEDMRVIDFSRDKAFEKKYSEIYGMHLGTFFTKVMFQFTKPVRNTAEYKVTQIISDHLRKTGVDGIAYRSFFTDGVNYTIFNCYPTKIEFCNSRVLVHKHANHVFLDLNNDKILESNPDRKGMEYEHGIMEEHRKKIAFGFKSSKK